MNQNAVDQIELNIREAREITDMGEALSRLEKNPDFQKVISQRYLKDEAVRLVHLKAAPNAQHEKIQASILRDIDAIGALEGFFNSLMAEAAHAQDAITACNDELVLMSEEGTE